LLYNYRQADLLLGCMIKDTNLANSTKYPMCKEDFKALYSNGEEETLFQLILYVSLHNLNERGYKTATQIVLDSYIKPHTDKYNAFLEEGGFERVETIEKLSDLDNFEGYYNNVRKMSLLRDAKADGDDISKFWDDTKSDDKNYLNLDEYTIDDIIQWYDAKAIKRRRKYIVDKDDDTTRKKAGDNGHAILKSFKETPKIGLSFESKYLTTLWDGFLKKNLYIILLPKY